MRKLNKIIGEAVLISPLFIVSIFFDLWSECALIIVLLFFYKSMYPSQYHADKNIVCIVLSYCTVIIGLVIAFVFRKQYALIILLFNAVAFMSARVGSMQRKAQKYELIAEPYTELVAFYNQVVAKKPFNTDTCTEAELIDRCRELHFSDDNIQLAIEFFIRKTPQRVIADRLYIDEKSVTTRKKRMKIKLNG